MSISLKALYDQVQGIKNSGGYDIQTSGNKFCITFSNNFKIQGCAHQGPTWCALMKNFSNTNYVAMVSVQDGRADSASGVYGKKVNGFSFTTNHNNYAAAWIAIGCLITNRLLTYIREVIL